MLEGMRHPELLPLFATALAIEVAHLRWVLLTQWTCKTCGTPVNNPSEHCPGCGAWAGGWIESAWLLATCLVPALWFAGYIIVLGLSH